MLLNDNGGIIDDLIVYRRRLGFRAVVNAARATKCSRGSPSKPPARTSSSRSGRDLAMIALQGPKGIDHLQHVTGIDAAVLSPFAALERDDWMVSRTGYTGEDGVEIMLPGADAQHLWRDS